MCVYSLEDGISPKGLILKKFACLSGAFRRIGEELEENIRSSGGDIDCFFIGGS